MSVSTAEAFTKATNKDSKAGSWVLVSLEKKKLSLVGEGEGIEGLVKSFDAKRVMWACLNVHGVDVRANVESVRTKLVQINWTGKEVPAMKRMDSLAGKEKVSKVFKGCALSIDAECPEDITPEDIVKRLCAAGGAHKPTFYAFGDGKKVDLGFYAPENK
ncbi:hypothetical protein AAMO2058_000026000 [Amorphochlora amoebiformis]